MMRPLAGCHARTAIENARSKLHYVCSRAPMPKGQILRSIKYRRAMRLIEEACNAIADMWPNPETPSGPVAQRRAKQ